MIEDSKLGYRKHVLDEFEFENGQVLRDVEVEYTTRGTPIYDGDGNVTNAVIYCHRFNGNCLSIEDLHQLVGPKSGWRILISFMCQSLPWDFRNHVRHPQQV